MPNIAALFHTAEDQAAPVENQSTQRQDENIRQRANKRNDDRIEYFTQLPNKIGVDWRTMDWQQVPVLARHRGHPSYPASKHSRPK
jgi:hypothetical protein